MGATGDAARKDAAGAGSADAGSVGAGSTDAGSLRAGSAGAEPAGARLRTVVTAVLVVAATAGVVPLLVRDADCGCVMRTEAGGLDLAVTAFVLSAVTVKAVALSWWARETSTTRRALVALGVLAGLAAASTWALGAWLYDPSWPAPDFLPRSASENGTASWAYAFDVLLLVSLLGHATTAAACLAGRDRSARAIAFAASTTTLLAMVAEWRAFPDGLDGGPLFFLLDARLGGVAFRDVVASAVALALIAFFWPATDRRRGVTRLATPPRSR